MIARGGAAAWLAAALIAVATIAVSALPTGGVPMPGHVVVAVMENHSFAQIVEAGKAPFIQGLAERGAVFTRSYAVTHPSEPNYFALFAGSTMGVADDGPYLFDKPTLAGALQRAGRSFTGYIETGSPRRHNPWESFAESRGVERDLAGFPTDFSALPTVAFVIPNLDDDMHDGSVEDGSAWLGDHLGAYADWCAAHGSVLVVTFDEDDSRGSNRIPTIVLGAGVRPGSYDERIDHYSVLRTIEAMYGLTPLAESAAREPIRDIWQAE
jgi:acid phosphatase